MAHRFVPAHLVPLDALLSRIGADEADFNEAVDVLDKLGIVLASDDDCTAWRAHRQNPDAPGSVGQLVAEGKTWESTIIFVAQAQGLIFQGSGA